MPDSDMRQTTPQRGATSGATSMASGHLPRIVIEIGVFTLYAAVSMLSLFLYVVRGASSIQLGQLTGAIGLVSWGFIAVLVGCEFDRCWGHTRIEHILTGIVCACIGLAMYNCLANVVSNSSLPTLEQLAPPMAVVDTSPIPVFVVVIPVMVLVSVQRRRAGARWWE
jgi:hypothetical protein